MCKIGVVFRDNARGRVRDLLAALEAAFATSFADQRTINEARDNDIATRIASDRLR
jgi:hypothetical protein